MIKKNYLLKKLIDSFFGIGSFTVFTLIFSLICTRLYGARIYGEYTYAYTLISFMMIIAQAGLGNGLIFSMPKNGNKHISLSFFVNFFMSSVIILLSLLFIDNKYILCMLPLVWLLSSEQLFFGVYRSEGRIKEYYRINGFISMLVRILIVIILYFFSVISEYSIATAVIVALIISNTIYYVQNREKFNTLIFDVTFIKYSLPLVAASILSTLIVKVDIIMLGNKVSSDNIGIYQVTIQISNAISIFLVIFNTIFAPQIAKLYHSKKYFELNRLYVKATRILAFIAVIALFVIIGLSGYILGLFGPEFVAGKNSLLFRGIGQFVNISVGGVWLMLSMTGSPKFQMYANSIAIIMNVTLNYLLIPIYGIDGAAFASMLTMIVTNFVGYSIVSKRFKVKVFKLF